LKNRLFILFTFTFFSATLLAQQRTYKLPENIEEGGYSKQKIVVRLKNTVSDSKGGRSASPIAGFQSEQFLSYLGNSSNKSRAVEHPLRNIYTVMIGEEQDPIEVINSLLENEDVLYAEPYFNHRPLFIPNDPDAQPGSNQWYLTNIRAYDAWNIEKGDSSIVIGILDSGVLPEHYDLEENIYKNQDDPINGLDDDEDGLIDNYIGWDIANNDNNPVSDTDIHGHGVAGISSASTNNGLGIAGVGFKSHFMPIKIFRSGSNFFSNGYEAIALAADLGCDVINLSWGSAGSFSQAGQDIIDYAVEEKDAVVVAAAGNTNALLNFYPASFKNVLSVAASNISDEKADFSTYSYNVDLVAPGKSIYVTDGDSTFNIRQGTSFSSPMVAGTAALLRARFPELSAKQIMEKVRVNADDIYDIPFNQSYIGQLGKGRLNVLEALTDGVSPALRIESFNYTNGLGEYAFYGDTLAISFDILNYLVPTSKATATISSTSPYVEIVNETLDIGVLATMETMNNDADPFLVRLSDDLPSGEELIFRVDFNDGLYEDFQYFTITSSEDYLNIDNGTLKMTAASSGELGYSSDIFKRGIGIEYKDQNILHNIGLIVTTASDVVKDIAPTNLGVNLRDHDFEAVSRIKFFQNSEADLDARSTIIDDPGASNPLGIKIEQKFLAWNDQSNSIVLEYRLINTSGLTISELHTGLFTDWDLNDRDYNEADWDGTNLIGYVRDVQSDTLYTGVALLSGESPVYHAINNKNWNGNTADIPYTITDAIKYDLLSDGISQTSAGTNGGGNDVSQASGYTINNLGANESKKLVFALVAGSSLAELQTAAAEAATKYQAYLDTPPLLHIEQTCFNDNADIDPPQGDIYEFYSDLELTDLLTSGTSYNTPVVTTSQTYYVVNKDEAYDGDIYRVKAQPKVVNADFSFDSSPLLLDETGDTNVQMNDLSVDAVDWDWDFGNGFSSNVQHPLMNYPETGSYDITLDVTSDLGCFDTVTKSLEVANRSNKPNITSPVICRGDELIFDPTNATDLKIYSDEGLTDLITTGTSFSTGKIYKDTTFYITSVDSTYESNPKRVKIEVSKITADFSYSIDSTDLAQKHLLNLKNESSNETLYLWYINEQLMGNSTDISYNYSGESNFDIKLIAEDINGCTDTLSQTITPKASPAPEATDFGICKYESVTITPESGNLFLFYNDDAVDSPLHKGHSFTIDSVENDTTIFVASIDSLFESDAISVNINVSEVTADFSITPSDSVDIAEAGLITIENTSLEADSYEWYVNDNLESTSEGLAYDMLTANEFDIELVASNSLGCKDSISKTLKITSITSVEPDQTALSIFPNPAFDKVYISSTEAIELKLMDLKGASYYKTNEKSNEVEIDMKPFPDGIYILEVTKGQTTSYHKIIKNSR